MAEVRVSVIGAGTCPPEVAERAEELGRLLARKGYAVVCGGLGGVMRAVSRGAREEGGRVIGVLPGLDRNQANEYVTCALATGLGNMRNYLVVINGDVVVAVEGGHGTLSEIGLALKAGRPVVAMGRYRNLDGVVPAEGPAEALQIIEGILGD